ncbi:ATP-dependent DNA helicase UvrD2 [Actinocrinis sp.]|uniref:ATP-dependent DNA helicase UvrD2 n=1 Tax=Actinocrinis sp. TaxID=1920516 RepID=UPI002D53D5D0|nr:ATP-dependent DNA helicase UvrD2 [Actinocrinis sp.]HZP50712.1 ATP-dependent DNA helicase UvrD2 [Actinocrinis sp.]
MTNPTAADSGEALLAGLDPEQRAVATALHGPVCVLAGAGTGKTRAITHRIAYAVARGVFPANQVLAVTFTARAAGEMRGRLRMLGAGTVQARTFHAAALRQLQYFWPHTVGGPPPQLIDTKLPLIAEAVAACRMRADRTELRDLASEIEWAKATQTTPDDYPVAAAKAGRMPPRDPAETGRVYAAYEAAKRDRGMIDFEDVLLLTIGVLETRPDIADRVRDQYRHFVVDEYQDVNPLQQRLLDCWLGKRDSVCVVGDASQTIYSFTGATPEYLLGFPDRYPDATVVRLVRDYRSTPQVVALANALLSEAPTDTLAQRRTARARVELVAQRPPGPAVEYEEYADETTEAEGVARWIRQLIDAGTRPAEIAVLFRINAQSEVYEQAFADLGVPYVVRGIERFFDRPEVRQAKTLLQGAAVAAVGADPEPLPSAVRAVLSSNGTWTPTPPAGSGRQREAWESLAALAALSEEYASAHPEAGLAEFVRELDARAAVQHAPVVDGVTLASLHSAKGLEWDAVLLVGLTEGLLPISYAETPDQVEEERRLLYVGVTRARERLRLSWALARSPGGRATRRPSRFLDALREAQEARSGGPGGSVVRGRGGAGRGNGDEAKRSRRAGPVRCRVCGRALIEAVERKLGRCADCPSDLDEALFERLREWRSARAKEQSLPAYCVFTDATLTAIAESRPADRAALAGIPGVGATKLERYAEDVLALLGASGGAADGDGDADGDEDSADTEDGGELF